MHLLLVPFALSLCSLAHADPREDAIAALAEGRQARALQILAASVKLGGEEALEHRCLLGRLEHQAGLHEQALETLAWVPDEAPCAMGAAWVRAEALSALGREGEAAEVHAALAEEALGPNRDARTADRLVGMADRVMEREEPNPTQAAAALTLALDLAVDPRTRLELSRRLADLALDYRLPDVARPALPALAQAVDAGGESQDRRRLALIVGDSQGLALLEDLPADPETQALRLRLGDGNGLGWKLRQVERLAANHPGAPETRRARLEVGRLLAEEGWRREAESVLGPVSRGFGADAAEASELLATMSLDGTDPVEALERFDDLVARFPRSEQRKGAEDALPAALLDAARLLAFQGDAERALSLYDRLSQGATEGDRDRVAAYEAGLLAWRGGDFDQARARWEEIPARWPDDTQAVWAVYRLLARDRGEPDGALAWLELRADEGLSGAAAVLEEVREPSLGVDSAGPGPDGGAPSVRVMARGIERVELRVHRIDLEAWLGAGWELSGLPSLDVGIIAPDRSWSVAVPDHHPHLVSAFEVPVSLDSPGLYAVTVATPAREVRTLLLHSDATLLTQRMGPKLAVAVLAEKRPQPGVRVLVREGGGIIEARTDASGLAVFEPGHGELLVVAESTRGPALAEVPAVGQGAPDDSVIALVDLDRPVYRPGDTVGFRIAVDRTKAPEQRGWQLWLEGGGGYTQLVKHAFEEGPGGTVVGELPLPLGGTGHSGIAAQTRSLVLMARLPGGSQRELARVRVADAMPEGRRLDVRVDERTAILELVEEDGSPAAGEPLDWTWEETGQRGRVLTDATGRARVQGPPLGVPWTLLAKQPGTTLQARSRPAPRRALGWSVSASQDRLRPGETIELQIDGEGCAELRLVRLVSCVQVGAPEEPWQLSPRWETGLQGPESWVAPPVPDPECWRETVRVTPLDVDGVQRVDLPTLPEGRYRVELEPVEGGRRSASWDFEVDAAAPRLGAIPGLGAGGRLALAVEGEPALVSVSGGRVVEAALLRPGQSAALAVTGAWRGPVHITAVTPTGRSHARSVVLSPAIEVDVQVLEEADLWRVRAVTTDAQGRPAAAQIALRALDRTLERQVGRALQARSGPFRMAPSWSWGGSWSAGLRHGAWSVPVARALLEEAAREDEARRARRALTGNFVDNAVQAALGEDVPLSLGVGGMGSVGYGHGGGGSAYGMGGIGTGGRGYGGAGLPTRPLQGERRRVLWEVLETDEEGVVEVVVPRPRRMTRWAVEAVAVGDGWVAQDRAEVTTLDRPRLLVFEPGPSLQDDRMAPTVVVMAGAERLSGAEVLVDGVPFDFEVGAGEAAYVPLGERAPGENVDLILQQQGEVLDRARWFWPLGLGVDAPGGPLLTAAVGPGGGPPLAWLAMAEDPTVAYDPGRAVVAARCVLAALPGLRGEEREVAWQRLFSLLGAVSTQPSQYRSVAEAA